jgi:hypothetical protein
MNGELNHALYSLSQSLLLYSAVFVVWEPNAAIGNLLSAKEGIKLALTAVHLIFLIVGVVQVGIAVVNVSRNNIA